MASLGWTTSDVIEFEGLRARFLEQERQPHRPPKSPYTLSLFRTKMCRSAFSNSRALNPRDCRRRHAGQLSPKEQVRQACGFVLGETEGSSCPEGSSSFGDVRGSSSQPGRASRHQAPKMEPMGSTYQSRAGNSQNQSAGGEPVEEDTRGVPANAATSRQQSRGAKAKNESRSKKRPENAATKVCQLCGTGAMGLDSFNIHVKGKKHLRAESRAEFRARNARTVAAEMKAETYAVGVGEGSKPKPLSATERVILEEENKHQSSADPRISLPDAQDPSSRSGELVHSGTEGYANGNGRGFRPIPMSAPVSSDVAPVSSRVSPLPSIPRAVPRSAPPSFRAESLKEHSTRGAPLTVGEFALTSGVGSVPAGSRQVLGETEARCGDVRLSQAREVDGRDPRQNGSNDTSRPAIFAAEERADSQSPGNVNSIGVERPPSSQMDHAILPAEVRAGPSTTEQNSAVVTSANFSVPRASRAEINRDDALANRVDEIRAPGPGSTNGRRAEVKTSSRTSEGDAADREIGDEASERGEITETAEFVNDAMQVDPVTEADAEPRQTSMPVPEPMEIDSVAVDASRDGPMQIMGSGCAAPVSHPVVTLHRSSHSVAESWLDSTMSPEEWAEMEAYFLRVGGLEGLAFKAVRDALLSPYDGVGVSEDDVGTLSEMFKSVPVFQDSCSGEFICDPNLMHPAELFRESQRADASVEEKRALDRTSLLLNGSLNPFYIGDVDIEGAALDLRHERGSVMMKTKSLELMGNGTWKIFIGAPKAAFMVDPYYFHSKSVARDPMFLSMLDPAVRHAYEELDDNAIGNHIKRWRDQFIS